MSRPTQRLFSQKLWSAALLAGVLGALALSRADGQASPSAFTSGTRYDAMHRATGTLAPDPDGTGALKYAAVRNSYDGAGRLIKVEKGELSVWQSESIAPASWTGFTIFQTVDTTYDSQSRKVKEVLSGGGSVQTVTQYSYDDQGLLQCTAVRMNPAVFGSLPASACTQSTQGANGPDRITKNLYDAAGELLQVRVGVGTSLDEARATYSYTPTGKREFTIDGDGNLAQFTYDGHDRLFEWVFPSKTAPTAFDDSSQTSALNTAGALDISDLEQYGYDLNGNRTSLRKRDGSTLNYTYDGLNRMTSKTVGATTAPPPADCSAVSFTIASNGAVTEGAPSVFTITKTGSASVNCGVSYATADSSAVAPGDYTAKSGTLTFPPTQTSTTVSVTTIDDSLIENAETFTMALSNPTANATLAAPGSTAATINDNDAPPNHAPVAVDDTANTTVCQTINILPLANDSDPDGDALSLVSVTGAGFTMLSATVVEYDAPQATGSYQGSYVVQDTHGAQATANIGVNVGSGTCTIGGGMP